MRPARTVSPALLLFLLILTRADARFGDDSCTAHRCTAHRCTAHRCTAHRDCRTLQSGCGGGTDGRLLFAPLLAPASESRVGFLWHADEARLRLDIGNSIDIVTFPRSLGGRLAIGADVATWTALRREANFHFPVDAVDYLFGVNASYARRLTGSWKYEARLRFSHISAHLVDGRYDKQAGVWLEGQVPRVYSREYVELAQAASLKGVLRVYALAQCIYHVDPPDLRPWAFAFGAEALRRHVLHGAIHAFAAYECRLAGNSAYVGNHTGQAGLLFGNADAAAAALYLQVYSGMSEHGEFYDERTSWLGSGLRVQF